MACNRPVNSSQSLTRFSSTCATLTWGGGGAWGPADFPQPARKATAQMQRIVKLLIFSTLSSHASLKIGQRESSRTHIMRHINTRLDIIKLAKPCYNANERFGIDNHSHSRSQWLHDRMRMQSRFGSPH